MIAELEANKELVRRYKVEILNARDLDALDGVVSDDYVDHAAFPGQASGRAGLKQRLRLLFAALDPSWTVNDMVAEGDRVAVRWSHRGVHRGDFLGLPATGRQFVFKGIDTYRIENGRLAEHWNVVDNLGFLQQVGAG
jgi:steroid delta-isomerase-like uncharacterized protein